MQPQGLAQQLAQQPQEAQQNQAEEILTKVVELLMQGADPQELVKQGVPVEVVKAAIQLIMQQQGQGNMPQGQATADNEQEEQQPDNEQQEELAPEGLASALSGR